MTKILATTNQLDSALEIVFRMPGNTESERLHRAVAMTNVRIAYCDNSMMWPALDAKQRAIFDDCFNLSVKLGIERS